jgi:hypothetical protein
MPPHPCNFIKQGDHLPCAILVTSENPIACCGTHAPIKARMPPLPEHSCEHIVKGGLVADHWCGRVHAAGERLCVTHVAMREREAANVRRRQEAAREWANNPVFIAQQAAAVEEARRQVAERQRLHVQLLINEAEDRARIAVARQQLRAVQAAMPPLQRLAQDQQNVHTRDVAKQTSEGEAKLLAVKTNGKAVGLRILRVFSSRAASLHQVMTVMNDVDNWYRQGSCRVQGDRLYGRVLEGLWTLIQQQSEDVRVELQNRLWEEMNESVGMCCDGHISRLVNVMVGFDESFKPPVSLGETLQAKMAALAGADVPTEEKLLKAKEIMKELAVPMDDQEAWLEALAT